MKKIKTIAVFLMLVLIALPATNVMGAISQKEENKTITLEYSIFREDGSRIVREITVDKNEIASFNEMIQQIFEKITSKNNYDIMDIIKDLKEKFGQNSILSIISTILEMRPLQKRVFILSNGYGTKLDLHLKRDISFHKMFSFWHYLGKTGSSTNSKTLIIDPIPDAQLQFYRLIEGQQIGIMTKFTGFYMRIPGNFIEQTQSHIFFFGYAVKVRAIDLLI